MSNSRRTFDDFNMYQLMAIAKELKITGRSRMRKLELVSNIRRIVKDGGVLPDDFRLPRKKRIPSRPAPVIDQQMHVPAPRTTPPSPVSEPRTIPSRRPPPPPPSPSTSTVMPRRPPPPPTPPRNLPEQTASTGTWLNWLGERILSLSRSVVNVLPERAKPFAEGLLNRVENVLRTEPMEMARPLDWEMPNVTSFDAERGEVGEREEIEEELIVPTEATNATPNLNLSEFEQEQIEVEEALDGATKTVIYRTNEGSVFDVDGFFENEKEDILRRLTDNRKPIKVNFVINCMFEMRKPGKPLDHTNL